MGSPRKEIAVAVRYRQGEDDLPVVVAKGTGVLAQRIRELADQHGIARREDPDLAQLLSQLELGSSIPPAAFVAMAEILACLYHANARLAARGATP
jgi:flagellar biosynthesis protein